MSPDWKKYQEEVSTLLRGLGFETEIDKRINGARGSHSVDVAATITVAGIAQLWAVECKLWNKPVPKERVLTFLSIVQDIGADRGLLFSESGFQVGAVHVSYKTNTSLTSLSDFKATAAEEIAEMRISALDRRAATLGEKILTAWHADLPERTRVRQRYVGPSDSMLPEGYEVVAVLGGLSQIRRSLEDGGFDKWPVAFWAPGHEFPFFARDWDGLLYAAEHIILTCERIYDHMTGTQSRIEDWRDFQSPEFSDLIEAITSRKEGSGNVLTE